MDGGGEGVVELYSTTLACRRVEQEDSRFRKIPFILYVGEWGDSLWCGMSCMLCGVVMGTGGCVR